MTPCKVVRFSLHVLARFTLETSHDIISNKTKTSHYGNAQVESHRIHYKHSKTQLYTRNSQKRSPIYHDLLVAFDPSWLRITSAAFSATIYVDTAVNVPGMRG